MGSEVKYAVTEFAWPSSTGNFDVAIASLGWTPKAVKVTLVGGVTHEAISVDSIYSVGFADGTNQAVSSGFDDNARSSIYSKRSSSASAVVIYHFVGGNSKISSVAAIADGWRFNAASTTGAGTKCIVEFFGGADLSANVHYFQPSTTGASSKTGLSFQPNLLFFTGIGNSVTGADSSGHNIFSYGCAYDGASVEQGCLLIEQGVDGSATQLSVAKLTNDAVAGQVHSEAETWRGGISAFNSDGYTFNIVAGNTGSDYVFCLALDIGDRKAAIKTVNAPTSAASDWAITGIGFKPQGVGFIAGMMESADVNALKTDQKAGYLSQGFSDGIRMYAGGSTVQDGAATSNTARVAANKFAYLLDTSDAALFDVGLPTFDVDGWTVAAADISTAQATQRKWLAFAIEEEASGGGSAALASNAAAQATAAAEATTAIPLAGATLSVATAAGVISTSVDMEAAASAISLLNGNIDTEIRVSVAAIAEALAQAGLDVQTLFAAAAAGQADSSGTLSGTGADLSAVAQAIADGNAVISVAITMQGDALGEALMQAGLTVGSSGLEGHASGQASSGGVISTAIELMGNSSAVVTAQGGIDTILQLQVAAAAASNALGGLTTNITFNAQALIQALAQAGLTTDEGLSGDAAAVAESTGWLKIKVSFEGDAVGEAVAQGNLTAGAIDIPKIARWTISAAKRNWKVTDKRSWRVCA